jgi:hypothetical protein
MDTQCLPMLEYAFGIHADRWFQYVAHHVNIDVYVSTIEELLPELVMRSRTGFDMDTVSLLLEHARFLLAYVPENNLRYTTDTNINLRWQSILQHIQYHTYDATGSQFGFLMLVSRILWPIAFFEASKVLDKKTLL